jgi:imidazoleglycerol phosphate dehydratase HisB
MSTSRTATVERVTGETQITCTIDLDHTPGVTKQVIEVSTGIGFLDHVSDANHRLAPPAIRVNAFACTESVHFRKASR